MSSYVNVAGYKFIELSDLEALKDVFVQSCAGLDLRGSVIFSPEGVNMYLSGLPVDIQVFVDLVHSIDAFSDVVFKESLSETHSYPKFKIKIKSHVVPSDLPVSPEQHTVRNMPPEELKRLLDEGEDIVMVDTRNYYETEAGLFEGAVDLKLNNFKDLPARMAQLLEKEKKKKMVMYCTGGIRCEKGGPIAEALGFEDVYQLEGGILNYFKQCGGAHYQGDCYVFDGRVAVKPDLSVSEVEQCVHCQHILTPEEQVSEEYKPGESCPVCVDGGSQKVY